MGTLYTLRTSCCINNHCGICVPVSGHQELRSSWDGWTLPSTSPEVACLGLQALFSRWLIPDLQVGAGSWQEASVLCCMDLPGGLLPCPHSMASPESVNAERASQKPGQLLCPSLGNLTPSLPHYTVGRRGSPMQYGRGIYKGINPRRKRSWGHIMSELY